MDYNVCRACLAPQGKIKYSSIFNDNGKIAKEIYKLTNLVILDLTDIDCPAVICQRCLMDLERAISFRELVIRSEDSFKESWSKAANKIIENLIKEVKTEDNIKLANVEQSIKSSSSLRNQLEHQEITEQQKSPTNCTTELESIVKLEQFEVKCVNNQNKNDKSSLKCMENLVKNPQKTSKIRHKTTKMRPNPANLDDKSQNLEKISTNLESFGHKQELTDSDLDEIERNLRQNSSQSQANIFQKLKNSTQYSQISEDFDNDSRGSDNSNDLLESSGSYQQFDSNFYQNPEDSFQINDFSLSSIKQEEMLTNQIEISIPKSKKRRLVTDYLHPELINGDLKCHICSKTFTKKCYLTQHFQTIHMTFKPHRCKKCGKKYESLTELNQHEEKHVADKPFKCSCCPKAFIYKSDLKRHEISHSVEKPFPCTMCSRGFVRNDHLLKHEKSHQRKIEKGTKIKAKIGGFVHEEVQGL